MSSDLFFVDLTSRIQLKPDHSTRPCYVLPLEPPYSQHPHIFLENFAQEQAQKAYEFLIAIAEPVSRFPTHPHIFIFLIIY